MPMPSFLDTPRPLRKGAGTSRIAAWCARGRQAAQAAMLCVIAIAGSACAAPPKKQCSADLRVLYDQVSPAVVRITGQAINPYRREHRVMRRLGSGFLIDKSGLILTNSHVVFGLQTMVVTLDDGTNLRARMVGADPIFDLALIQIPVPKDAEVPVLKLGDSDLLKPGDDVIAIGNPLGLDQTITRGIVSGLNRQLSESPLSVMEPLIQTDAAINPGNSGGPLLDHCGEVIGVNTAIISDAQNIGFAIPSNLARAVLPNLIKDGRIIRPWVGFHGQLVGEEVRKLLQLPIADGLLVEVVEPGSPAEKAEVRGGEMELSVGDDSLLLGGDIVVSVNGTPLNNPENVVSVMRGLRVGNTIRLRLFRRGEYRDVSYVLPERPLLPGDIPDGDAFMMTPAGAVRRSH
jgi:S1-C subfamily serine protease